MHCRRLNYTLKTLTEPQHSSQYKANKLLELVYVIAVITLMVSLMIYLMTVPVHAQVLRPAKEGQVKTYISEHELESQQADYDRKLGREIREKVLASGEEVHMCQFCFEEVAIEDSDCCQKCMDGLKFLQ